MRGQSSWICIFLVLYFWCCVFFQFSNFFNWLLKCIKLLMSEPSDQLLPYDRFAFLVFLLIPFRHIFCTHFTELLFWQWTSCDIFEVFIWSRSCQTVAGTIWSWLWHWNWIVSQFSAINNLICPKIISFTALSIIIYLLYILSFRLTYNLQGNFMCWHLKLLLCTI